MASGDMARWAIPSDLVLELGLSVVSPFELSLGGERRKFAVLFQGFGAPRGMVTDPVWANIEPFADELLNAGFGHSCVDMAGADRKSLIDALRDWEWCGPAANRPQWL